jgi:NHLM bacteriocin system ABC transporter ATP-binding protein
VTGTASERIDAADIPAPRGMLRLDGSERVYIVHDAEVDVFLLPLCNGDAEGNRIHLFAAPTGTVLFSAPKADDDGLALIACLADGKAMGMSIAEFRARVSDRTQTSPLLAGVEAWIRGLSTAIMRPLQGFEPQSISLASGERSRVAAGSCLSCSGEPVWLEIDEGEVLYINAENVVPACPVRIPLATHSFVRTAADCSVRCVDSATAWDEGWALQAINALNSAFLRLCERNRRTAAADEQLRRQRRARAEHHAASTAIVQLAAPLNEDSAGSRPVVTGTSSDPLFLACAAVTDRLGYPITAPPRSDAPPTWVAALDAIARHNRLMSRRIRLELEWWRNDVDPFLLMAGNDRQPVAILPSGLRGHYELFDPATGRTTKLDERAASALSGEAHVFTVPFPGRSLNVSDVGGNAWRWNGPDIAALIGFTITAGILAMGVPIATGVIADELIPNNNVPKLVELSIVLLVVTALSAWLRCAVQIAAVRIEGRTGSRLQAAVMERLLALPAAFFRDYTAGGLAKRALAIQTIERVITGSIISGILGAAFALVSLALMFYYSVILAAVALGVMVLMLALTTLLGLLRKRVERESTWIGGQVSGLLLPLAGGIQKIRLAGSEHQAFLQWARLQGQYEQYRFVAERYGVFWKFAATIFPLVSSTVVFATVAYVIYGGTGGYVGLRGPSSEVMGIGQLLAFFAAFNQATSGIYSLSNVALQLLTLQPQLAFAAPILQARPEADFGKLDPGELSGAIDFSHVTFRYRPELPAVLNDFSLGIEAGEYVAIVGPSGGGKSTLLRLLLGFAIPEAGATFFDGRDLKHLDLRALRRQFGVVLQGGRLMGGSLLENILGSNLHLGEDAAWRAADQAGIADEIHAMPMGMQTRITGARHAFSGGQVQRILVARALIAKPRIVLLDEATSALDNRTQAIITKTLTTLTVTRIVIAHRLSTVRHAHRIIVLLDGRVVESGTYEQLMASAGVFRQLAERQLIATDAG